jgi:DNA-binding protein H-NS
MATYKELKSKMEHLALEAEAAREKELEAVIVAIRTQIAEYGLTKVEVFGSQRDAARLRSNATTKFRDPKTGATWSGRGRPPAWLAGKNRDRFMIKE